jgi:4-carboxymuconolactone decarboxylase
MARLRRAPKAYDEFVKRFPKLGRAWELLGEAGDEAGPLSVKNRRLVKLAVAIGARQEGAVHSGVRKAVAAGASQKELEQVVALAASLIGLPATVAAFGWVREQIARG